MFNNLHRCDGWAYLFLMVRKLIEQRYYILTQTVRSLLHILSHICNSNIDINIICKGKGKGGFV